MTEEFKSGAQTALALRALALKQANETPPHHPPTGDHAEEGVQAVTREDYPPSGAFDAEHQRPVLERSRKVR